MSNVGVDGDSNRVAGRDYIEVNVGNGTESKEFLVAAQRKSLNALVAEISSELSVEARIIWSEVVHAQVGVQSINDIPRDKFIEAQGALVAYRDRRRELAATQALVARILQTANDKGVYLELTHFCTREYGEQKLKSPSRAQLLRALGFVEDFQKQAAPKPVINEDLYQKIVREMRAVVFQYPRHFAAVFLVGALIGRLVL